MRQATNDTDIVEHNGTFVGFNLGWDYCAEHEWGIGGIISDFGIGKLGTIGFPARTTSLVPPIQILVDKRHAALVYPSFDNEYWQKEFAKKKFRGVFIFPEMNIYTNERFPTKNGIAAAWDASSFGIHVLPEHVNKLKELYDAFQRKDICIFIGGRLTPFSNGGLMILIASRIPQEFVEKCKEMDEEHLALQKAGKEAGILEVEKTLKQAGKPIIFLGRPQYDQAEHGEKVLKFWLNASDAFGWYTIDELKQWLKNEGPIALKEQEAISKREKSND